jgi:hypothetical protein
MTSEAASTGVPVHNLRGAFGKRVYEGARIF